jgi:LPXTG-site transpeptidase (sortase) family protein
MIRPNWMILAGSLLLIAVLVNSITNLRNSNLPFDEVGSPSSSVIVPAQGNPPQEVSAPTLSINTENSNVQEAQALTESDADRPPPTSLVPDRIAIPSIGLDAPIVPVIAKIIKYDGKDYQQWVAPDEYAAGWHATSAKLGDVGNTVLNGHHNAFGQVFASLHKVKEGEIIKVYSGEFYYDYIVARRLLLPEKFNTLSNRMENASWISPSTDERLTLITCWPPESNIYRVIIVALPVR